ncbi:hypothetical protein HK098_007402 [Nowakowskiella sp. JEL0407]|nr:hypothetical protein HK098_007402 [Nowakowskiella sp. JEL0407]
MNRQPSTMNPSNQSHRSLTYSSYIWILGDQGKLNFPISATVLAASLPTSILVIHFVFMLARIDTERLRKALLPFHEYQEKRLFSPFPGLRPGASFRRGANQSAEDSTKGYHVLKVVENSPADIAGLVPYFDYIISINDILLEEDTSFLLDTVRSNVNKPVKLGVYSSKREDLREVILTPANWSHPKDGVLGCSVRFCDHAQSSSHVWHVLDIHPNSPAALAGLNAHTDYIIATPHTILKEKDDLYNLIEKHVGKALQLFVYNVEWDGVREVLIVPNFGWGGNGCLGCDIGYGYLHRIPIHGQNVPEAIVGGQVEVEESGSVAKNTFSPNFAPPVGPPVFQANASENPFRQHKAPQRHIVAPPQPTFQGHVEQYSGSTYDSHDHGDFGHSHDHGDFGHSHDHGDFGHSHDHGDFGHSHEHDHHHRGHSDHDGTEDYYHGNSNGAYSHKNDSRFGYGHQDSGYAYNQGYNVENQNNQNAYELPNNLETYQNVSEYQVPQPHSNDYEVQNYEQYDFQGAGIFPDPHPYTSPIIAPALTENQIAQSSKIVENLNDASAEIHAEEHDLRVDDYQPQSQTQEVIESSVPVTAALNDGIQTPLIDQISDTQTVPVYNEEVSTQQSYNIPPTFEAQVIAEPYKSPVQPPTSFSPPKSTPIHLFSEKKSPITSPSAPPAAALNFGPPPQTSPTPKFKSPVMQFNQQSPKPASDQKKPFSPPQLQPASMLFGPPKTGGGLFD